MPERIPQSATIRVPLQAYLSSDHVSPATGKTIPIAISKNGGAYANPSAGATNATEIGSGSYYVDLSTTDAGTLGPLFVKGTEGTIDAVVAIYDVVKATNAGFTGVPDAAAGANAGLPILSSSATTLAYTVSTVTTLTDLPTIPSNWLTAAGLAADAVAEIAAAISIPSFPANFSSLVISGSGVADVRLADAVAHGGPPGSSTATFAMQLMNVTNPSGIAAFFEGQGGAVQLHAVTGIGLYVVSDSGHGMAVNAGGGVGWHGMVITGDTGGRGVYISATGLAGDGAGIHVESSGCPAVVVVSDDHAVSITASGSGKHGIISTGGTDGDGFHGVGAGTGVGFRSTPDAVGFGSGGGGTADVNVVSFTAGALAQFFTTDTGERYAEPYSDAVDGSVVAEIVRNTGIDEATLVADIDTQLSNTHGAGPWGGLSATEIRTAIGMASANLDLQLSGIQSDVTSIASTLDTVAGDTTTIITQTSGTLDAAGVRAAVGLASANLDGQLAGILSSVGLRLLTSAYAAPLTAAQVRTAVGLASANLDAQFAAIPTTAQNADKLLGRNLEGGSDSGRTVRQALYFLRNKWDITGGILTVCDTSDSPSWTAVVTQSSATPVTGIDP